MDFVAPAWKGTWAESTADTVGSWEALWTKQESYRKGWYRTRERMSLGGSSCCAWRGRTFNQNYIIVYKRVSAPKYGNIKVIRIYQ